MRDGGWVRPFSEVRVLWGGVCEPLYDRRRRSTEGSLLPGSVRRSRSRTEIWTSRETQPRTIGSRSKPESAPLPRKVSTLS